MAYPITLGSVIEVVVGMRLAGAAGDAVPINTILHYRNASPTQTPPPLGDFLVQLKAMIKTAWIAWMPNACTCDFVNARYVNDGTSAAVLDPTPTDYSGAAGSGDFQPGEVSAFLEKLTPWRYRGGRPGVHLGAVLESYTTDFRLSTSGFSAAGAVVAVLNNVIPAAGGLADAYSPCVYSTKYSPPDPVTRVVVPMGAPVSSMRARRTLGRMIRRSVRGVY